MIVDRSESSRIERAGEPLDELLAYALAFHGRLVPSQVHRRSTVRAPLAERIHFLRSALAAGCYRARNAVAGVTRRRRRQSNGEVSCPEASAGGRTVGRRTHARAAGRRA